jgi:hypothetical protein
MKKENLFIAFTLLVIACVAAFFILYAVTQRNRDSTVGRFRAKAAVVREKMEKPRPPEAVALQPKQKQEERPVMAKPQTDTADEYAIEVYKQFIEKMQTIETNPEWRETFFLLPNWDKWTEEERAKVAEFLNANRDLISDIRHLADAGGPFIELDLSKGFEIELPHLANLRAYARILAADTTLASARGDYGEVGKNLDAMMKLAYAIGEEPILISQLVRIAITGIFYNNVSQCIPTEIIPSDLVEQILQITADADGRDGFADSFSMEGLIGLDAFDNIRSGEDVERMGDISSIDDFLVQFYGSILARPFLYMDQEDYANIMERMTDTMKLPFYEAQPELERINDEIENLPRTRVLSRILLPALTRAAEAQARHEAQLGLMRLGLAVELYHDQTGEYPQTLEDIAPTVGGEIPLDPFTGMPFVYEPSGDRFTLYSARGSIVSPVVSSHNTGNIVWRGQPE